MSEFLLWNPPKLREIISNGILHPEEVLVLHGSFKSWKSMLAMHTAFCISQGVPWFGYNTEKSSVLIVQVEISEIMYHKRCIKYAHFNFPTADTSNIFIASEVNMKFDKAMGMSELDRDLEHYKPQVVILDPLYKMVSGDLNNGRDMMGFIDNIDILKYKYHCSFIIVHHEHKMQYTKDGSTIKQGAEAMTGSQYFANTVDSSIGISRMSDDWAEPVLLKMEFDALRNAEKFPSPINLTISRDDLVFREKSQTLTLLPISNIINTKLVDSGTFESIPPEGGI
jgi:hypothetical protein